MTSLRTTPPAPGKAPTDAVSTPASGPAAAAVSTPAAKVVAPRVAPLPAVSAPMARVAAPHEHTHVHSALGHSCCFLHDAIRDGGLTGKPEIGAYGFDEEGMDRSVAPGDDFNQYASGTALAKLQIPADRSGVTSFVHLDELSKSRTKELIEAIASTPAAKGSDEKRIGDFFASYMNEAAIEKLGATPLAGELAAIADIKTGSDVARMFGTLQAEIQTPLGFGVNPDDKLPLENIVQISQSGLGLPDRDYFLSNDPKLVETREKYKTHIANMLRLAGVADPETKAEGIFALEHKIAEAHWTNVDSRDASKVYNKWSRADFDKLAPGVDWQAYFGSAGVADQKQFLVAQPSAITGIARLVQDVPVSTWRDYLTFKLVKGNASVLSKDFVDESFAFSGKILQGIEKNQERWKRAVDFTSVNLGEAVGKLYVAKYFPPETKRRADELVKNVIAAMGERLNKLTWMTPETRAKAVDKLNAFTAKIGYPEVWRDYSSIETHADDLYGNNKRASAFEYKRNLDKLKGPVDRREWFMTPMTVNAYANPVMNEIVFPAAIMQPPFFDPNADDAVNYGGIGAVIGHEISHHFDDQGRKYDKNGALTDWWTEKDVELFKRLTDEVVKQFNGFEPLPGLHVNGKLTLGENMADLAGITVAYDAYKRSLGGKEAPVINGTTGYQRFFFGWAQVWRGKYREQALRQRLLTDPHSPSSVRAGIVRNIDAWYAAFEVKQGQKMYLGEGDRLRVW